MSLVQSSFLNYVVALGVPDSNKEGSIRFIGTGFLYGHFSGMDEGKPWYYPYLVTNRHVIAGPNELMVRLNGRQAPVVWRPDYWSTHPDPQVDVAVAPFHLADNEEFKSWFLSNHHVYFRDELKKVGFMEGDEVYTLGFPMGLTGDERNYVIVRQGIVARIRDWYEDQSDVFLIDAFIYPGNSGGPVIAKPTMFSYVETRPHPKLIGMVSGYVPYQDFARSDQTGAVVSVSTENSGLAEVVPIDKVTETIEDVLERKKQN